MKKFTVLVSDELVLALNWMDLNFRNNYKKISYKNNYDDLYEIVNNCSLFGEKTNLVIFDIDQSIKKLNNDIICESSVNFNLFFIIDNKYFEKNKSDLKNAEIIFIKKLTKSNVEKYIRSIFELNNINLNESLIKYLSNKMNFNILSINNEINKLIKLKSNKISKEIIDNVIFDFQESNIFKLVNSFIKNDFYELFKAYYSLINQNYKQEHIISVFILNFFKYKILYVEYLKNGSFLKAAESYGISKYEAKNISEIFNFLNYNKINVVLNLLADLDLKIKQGKIDSEIGLKLFLIGGCHE